MILSKQQSTTTNNHFAIMDQENLAHLEAYLRQGRTLI
jgi:hypothetical protein